MNKRSRIYLNEKYELVHKHLSVSHGAEMKWYSIENKSD